MDNPILLEEKQQPLKASVLDKMPKDKELHSSVPDDTLLADPRRYYYSLLEQ
jgi:hypothetical protein